MKSRVKTALGIDIGEHHVSAALVETDERDWRVVASAGAELAGGDSSQRRSGPAKALSRVLRQLGRRAAVRRARAAVAVSTSPMVMQLLEIPRSVPTNISEFVQHELRQYVPLSGTDILSDFCGIGVPGGPRKRLLAVAADRGHVVQMARLCLAAGVDIGAMEPSALAYARGFLTVGRQASFSRTVLIGVLGRRDLTMCLFRKGALDFVRVRALPPETETAATLCAWLTEELRAVMRYYDMEVAQDGAKWQARLIVGHGTYRAADLTPFVAAETDMNNVAVVDPCDEPGVQAGWQREPATEKNQTVSMGAIGAALKLLHPETDEFALNLLPDEVRRTRRLSRHLLAAANAVALVIIGMLLAGQWLARANGAMQQRIERTRLSRQLHTAPTLIAQEQALDREIAGTDQQLKRLRLVRTESAPDWSAVLKAIAQAAPPGMCITHLASHDNRNLTLNGLAQSTEAVQAFVQGLDGQTPFESVRLAKIQRTQDRSGLIEYQVHGLLGAWE